MAVAATSERNVAPDRYRYLEANQVADALSPVMAASEICPVPDVLPRPTSTAASPATSLFTSAWRQPALLSCRGRRLLEPTRPKTGWVTVQYGEGKDTLPPCTRAAGTVWPTQSGRWLLSVGGLKAPNGRAPPSPQKVQARNTSNRRAPPCPMSKSSNPIVGDM
jgi:hypothetical protein